MTGAHHPAPPPADAADALAAARTRAAELGLSVSEYVREQLRRTRGEEAWERAVTEVLSEKSDESDRADL